MRRLPLQLHQGVLQLALRKQSVDEARMLVSGLMRRLPLQSHQGVLQLALRKQSVYENVVR